MPHRGRHGEDPRWSVRRGRRTGTVRHYPRGHLATLDPSSVTAWGLGGPDGDLASGLGRGTDGDTSKQAPKARHDASLNPVEARLGWPGWTSWRPLAGTSDCILRPPRHRSSPKAHPNKPTGPLKETLYRDGVWLFPDGRSDDTGKQAPKARHDASLDPVAVVRVWPGWTSWRPLAGTSDCIVRYPGIGRHPRPTQRTVGDL